MVRAQALRSRISSGVGTVQIMRRALRARNDYVRCIFKSQDAERSVQRAIRPPKAPAIPQATPMRFRRSGSEMELAAHSACNRLADRHADVLGASQAPQREGASQRWTRDRAFLKGSSGLLDARLRLEPGPRRVPRSGRVVICQGGSVREGCGAAGAIVVSPPGKVPAL